MDNRGGRRRLSYANVMATIAVFGVLAGGGAWAADKIGSGDIAKNAVRSKHIKNKQVKVNDLAPAAAASRSGTVNDPTDVSKTIVNLPGIGRFVTRCSFMSSGNTSVYFQNRSGKELIIALVNGTNQTTVAGFDRAAVPDGQEQRLVGTGGATTANSGWLSIVPSGGAARPQVQGTATALHGCGKTTVHVVSTKP